MQNILVFVLQGLGEGAVFGALALGLVITYKATGVINFAAGAMGVWCAYVFQELRTTGRLVFPVGAVHVGDPGNVASVVIVTAVGVVLGLFMHLIFRPLRHAPVLAKVVASGAVLLMFLSLIPLRFGSDARIVPAILPSNAVVIWGSPVNATFFWLAGIMLALAIAVSVWFRVTRTGLAIRAAAENERFASLAGLSPDLLGATAWSVSGAIGALVITFASPQVGGQLTAYGWGVTYIVYALAAALVGRLSAVVPAALAGLVLGILDSEFTYFANHYAWWPSWANTTALPAIPLVAVLVILFVSGDPIPSRGAIEVARLPTVIRPRRRPVVGLALLAAGVVLVAATHGSYRFSVTYTMATALVMLSLYVLTGMLGQVSFAQASLAGAAGFLLSKLSTSTGIPFPIAPLLAVLAATVVGILVSVPALRIRGVQLAVVTLAFAAAFDGVVLANPSLQGEFGNPVPDPKIFGIDLGVRAGSNTGRWQFGIFVLIVLSLATIVVANLARSSTGRRFLAVRSNERASASIGIDVTKTKLFGFAFSAFLAGLGGVLIAYSYNEVSSATFQSFVGISWLIFAYLGGIGSIGGAINAGTFVTLGIAFTLIDRLTHLGGNLYATIISALLVTTLWFNPEGVSRFWRELWELAQGARAHAPQTMLAAGDEQAERPVRPVRTAGAAVLATDELTVRFGGLVAVDGVSLEVKAGQIVGLIGANGAGKTTFIDAVSGFVPYRGRATLDGRPLDGLQAFKRSRAGLARTWQSLELFNDLTVIENLQVAQERPGAFSALGDLVLPGRLRRARAVDDAAALMRLGDVLDRSPNELPLGRQKMVNVARALVNQPRVMLLDEPAAGLSTSETIALGDALLDIANDALGILLVEHDVSLVFEICDYVYVLDRGRLIAEGTPAEIRRHQDVIAAYLGGGYEAEAVAEGVEVLPEATT